MSNCRSEVSKRPLQPLRCRGCDIRLLPDVDVQVWEFFEKTLYELKSWPSGNEVHADDFPGVLLAWNHPVSISELARSSTDYGGSSQGCWGGSFRSEF